MEEDRKPAFSLPEIILGILILGSVDIFEFITVLLDAVPVLGQVLAFAKLMGGLVVWLSFQFYLIMKGQRALWFLAGNLIEEIGLSFVNWLPLRTITFIVTVVMANKEAAGKGGQVLKALKTVKKV